MSNEAVQASDDGTDHVKAALKDRARELVQQEWCTSLLDIEGPEKADVVRRVESDIDALQSGSSLLELGRELIQEQHRVLLSTKRTTGQQVAAAVMAVLIPGVSAGFVIYTDEWATVFVGVWLLAVTLWIPEFIGNRYRRRNGLEQAPADLQKVGKDLDRRLRSVIEKAIRLETSLEFTNPAADHVVVDEGLYLSSRALKGQCIGTSSRELIELHLLRSGGAAIGVTGERGVGKSEVLRFFSEDSVSRANIQDGGTIGVFVAVPAAFKGIDFLKLALRRLAEAVPGEDTLETQQIRRGRYAALALYIGGAVIVMLAALGLSFGYSAVDIRRLLGSEDPNEWNWTANHLLVAVLAAGVVTAAAGLRGVRVASRRLLPGRRVQKGADKVLPARSLRTTRLDVRRQADQLRDRLRYAESISLQTELSATISKLGIKRSRQQSLSSLPLTEADLVDEFRRLAHDLEQVGYRVFVCVDEMDKLDPGDATDQFLNSVKQLFSIRSASFIVSVSCSAWSRFVRRGVDVRDALDSSLDAIETLAPLDFLESRSLIQHRREKMTDTQVLLCHALSGGLPRELLRAARTIAHVNHREGGCQPLTSIARIVVDQEFEQVVDASLQLVESWAWPVRESIGEKLIALKGQRQDCSDNGYDLLAAGNGSIGQLQSHPDALAILERTRLYGAYLSAVCALFCSAPDEWETTAVAAAERLAWIRRSIEANPADARKALRDLTSAVMAR